MTRGGGWAVMLPEALGSTPGLAITRVMGWTAVGTLGRATEGGFFGRKSGVVLEPGGAPVSGGAFGGSCGTAPEGARDKFGIGLVTAVDQAGGVVGIGVGSDVPVIGSVVAAEIFGRGVIFVDAGLSGRGGKLMRRVSRCGACGSEPGEGVGLAESAMGKLFIVISGNVQWRNS